MQFKSVSRNINSLFLNFLSLLFLFFLFLAVNVSAQINNNAFIFEAKSDSIHQTKWKIDFQSLSYFQNREYFGQIADGYTLFGNLVAPKIIYKPSSKVSIEAGAFIKKDFGNDGIKEIQPIFTILIEKDSTKFRFGNLNGNLNHQLIEPLYSFEGIISNNLESGIQLTKIKNGNFFDFWVDWQRMIYQKSPFKEEIWGGVNWKPVVYKKNNFQFKIPIQFTAYHKGGQITIDNRPLKTEINLAIGTETSWQKDGFFERITLQNYLLAFKEQSNVIKEYKSGMALYLNATFENKKFNTMFSYFYGNSFNSFAGGDLYQSINKNESSNTEQYRKLLIVRLYKDICIIPNLYLVARFEPYYDLVNKQFEHSEGLFISYKEQFGLGRKTK
ncbi:MAG: hypothetical protein V4683_12470 [Bacteroidota bacterium]